MIKDEAYKQATLAYVRWITKLKHDIRLAMIRYEDPRS